MGKTIIICTHEMILSFPFVHAWSPCTCVYVQKCLRIHKLPQYCAQKSSVVWPNPVLVQGMHCLQYNKCLVMQLPLVIYATYLCDVLNFLAGPQLHVASTIML